MGKAKQTAKANKAKVKALCRDGMSTKQARRTVTDKGPARVGRVQQYQKPEKPDIGVGLHIYNSFAPLPFGSRISIIDLAVLGAAAGVRYTTTPDEIRRRFG